ncbi:NUDIX hydrolase [soil metagenome]
MDEDGAGESVHQAGVIPYRMVAGKLEILLISAGGERWIVPKGHVEPFMTASDSASQEAWEEAGIRGEVGFCSLGKWSYEKRGAKFDVDLFPFEVKDMLKDWPEEKRRKRRWLSFEKALKVVTEPALRQILRLLPDVVQPAPGS